MKTKLSYEYSSKHIDVGQEVAIKANNGQVDPTSAREQAILKKIMGLNNKKTLIESAPSFFSEKEEEADEKPAHTDDGIKKIKNCSVCKVQKMNHLMREFNNNQPGNDNNNWSTFGLIEDQRKEHISFGDDVRYQMNKLAPRDVIEQIIFDPHHGIVKREIHFGIIDYMTSYPMKKRLDELNHLNGNNSSANQAVRPAVYKERFLTTMRKIFE